MLALELAAALSFSAVSLSTATVPARGAASALVTLDRAAMVRLKAASQNGTQCDIVDRVRGPFAHSGEPGVSSCLLDLLLDRGTYKLRLQSPDRGKGNVDLAASEFEELNPAPKRLAPTALQRFKLASGQQASFWLTMPARDAPMLRISGRSAGDVRLWRNGEWLEPIAAASHGFSPEPGRPIHEWWFNQPLEAGDYLVRVYGTNGLTWASGDENDDVEVELGFRDGPVSRALPFTLGRSGYAAVRVPEEQWIALLTLDTAPGAGPVELSTDFSNTCRIEKKALVPQCAAWTSGVRNRSHWLMVRGPAGTKGVLEWAPPSRQGWWGGYYGTPTANLSFTAHDGRTLVGLHDLPLDTDAAPLGCLMSLGPGRIATDFPQLGDGRMFDAPFNYDGSSGQIWFDVTSAGRYRIETTGGRKTRCELYRFKGADLERLSPSSSTCALTLMLAPGAHQLSLFGGTPGIEHLVIKEEGRKDLKPIPPKAGCLLGALDLVHGEYIIQTNRIGALAARGIVAAPLPLRLDAPVHLTLDPGRKLTVPLTSSRIALAQLSNGLVLPVGPTEASLANGGDVPLSVTLWAPETLPAPPAMTEYAPKLEPLPSARAGTPVFFDFAAGESHSLLFDVDKPGLYHVTTQGLLATTCTLRTQVISGFATDQSSGRGRNCLVAGYLKPGRYMMTVATLPPSAGRASVVLSRRPVREQGALVSDADAFFRAEPGELVQQKLTVPSDGDYQLNTNAQGDSGVLKCRLDDADGWPLMAVPAPCSTDRTFAKGTYLWTQLPLTVESMRHSSLVRVAAPAVLAGDKPHALEFFTGYDARLGSDGKDEFTFTLEAPADVRVALTNGMQGRLYLGARAVELIPPAEAPRTVHLEPGAYRLVAEHSRGDVAIEYRLELDPSVLMPGMTERLSVPTERVVKVARDGILKLKTRGDADVRCRLFDASGKLVFEGSDDGADWNCSIAEPITKGEYRLVLETETQLPGASQISLALARAEAAKPAADSSRLELRDTVQVVQVPPSDTAQSFAFSSKGRIACALEDAAGAVVARQCSFTVRPKSGDWRVKVWTTDRSATATLAWSSKPAALAKIGAAGLWRTAPGVLCIEAGKSGAMRPCGPEVSLEAGDYAFSEAVSPEEVTLQAALATPRQLTRQPFIEAVTAAGTVALLEAHVQHGEPFAPACGFIGSGVRDARDRDCFAASDLSARSTARLWVPGDVAMTAATRVRPIAVPPKRGELKPGHERLDWSSEAATWQLPAQPLRVTLTLPPQTWAVQLDAKGAAVDLCAPGADLTSCAFTGVGGSVLLVADKESRAEAELELISELPRAVAFDGLYEARERTAGLTRLNVPAAPSTRTLVVEGAQRCVLTLSDGTRLAGCRSALPAQLGAELKLEHSGGPVRVVAYSEGAELKARLGAQPQALPPAPIAASTALSLMKGSADRTIVVERDAVVRVSSGAGVCALLEGNSALLGVDGFGAGCELTRVLKAGTYRALVRPFAGEAEKGSFTWTQQPLSTLRDGVGAEAWIAPGDSLMYRFQIASAGHIGLGVQTKDESLDCAIYDERHHVIGEGCQQYLKLAQGTYLVGVRLPPKPGAAPLRFKPVLLGLSGAKAAVPQAYLDDFFQRNGSGQ